MIAMSALTITATMTLLVSIVLWLAESNVPYVSSTLDQILPNQSLLPGSGFGLTVLLQVGFFLLTVIGLRHLYGFAEETQAAPRQDMLAGRRMRPRRHQGRFWSATTRLFVNPVGYWIWPFAIPVMLIVLFAMPLVRLGLFDARPWGLSLIFAVVLWRIASHPDSSPPPSPLLEHVTAPQAGLQLPHTQFNTSAARGSDESHPSPSTVSDEAIGPADPSAVPTNDDSGGEVEALVPTDAAANSSEVAENPDESTETVPASEISVDAPGDESSGDRNRDS